MSPFSSAIWLAFLTIFLGTSFADEVDIEFDKYKSNDSINKYFYKGRVDSTFHKEFQEAKKEEELSRMLPLFSPLYYLLPIETVLLYAPFYENKMLKTNYAFTPLFASLAILPPAGHVLRIKSMSKYNSIQENHGLKQNKSSKYYESLYATATLIRWLLPLYILKDYQKKNEDGMLPPSIILVYLPSFLQLFALNNIDENIVNSKSILDELNLSPSIGVLPDNSHKISIFCGLRHSF